MAFENCTNNLLVFDYDLKLISKLDGIEGPALSKAMTWSTIASQNKNHVVWLKGNHQAALIDVDSMEEIDRAPLFGTVNTYSENIPLLASYSQGNWCGYFFMNNDYHLSWMQKNNDEKQCMPVNKVIPEAKSIHSMNFDPSGKYLILVIGSSREISQSSFVLISLIFGDPFPLVDYFRITDNPPNFCPMVTTSIDHSQWVLNSGSSVAHFKVESGTFIFKDTVEGISAGIVYFI